MILKQIIFHIKSIFFDFVLVYFSNHQILILPIIILKRKVKEWARVSVATLTELPTLKKIMDSQFSSFIINTTFNLNFRIKDRQQRAVQTQVLPVIYSKHFKIGMPE